MYQPEFLVIALSTLGLILRTQVAQFRDAYQRAVAREREMRQLRASEVQARRAAEEAARIKSQFLAHVSHEVRTPLNAISGTAQMLQQTPLTAEQQEYVEVLATGSETLQALLADILDYARIEAGKIELAPQPVCLAEAIDQALRLVQAQAAERNLQLVRQIAHRTPETIAVDPLRLRQVLLNLLSNAVKFTASGTITVSAGLLGAGRANLLRISVSDTGRGVPLHEQESLFQPFVQGGGETAARHGVGLGLAICRELVTLMGGEIWLDSRPGEGATFTFTLPVDD